MFHCPLTDGSTAAFVSDVGGRSTIWLSWCCCRIAEELPEASDCEESRLVVGSPSIYGSCYKLLMSCLVEASAWPGDSIACEKLAWLSCATLVAPPTICRSTTPEIVFLEICWWRSSDCCMLVL